ncbi:MAG: protein kinase domain-containing protein [Phycisphaerales bacterium]
MTTGGSLLRRAEEVFHAVADLPDAERGAALERRCVGDAELKTAVERLFEMDSHGEHWLEQPVVSHGGLDGDSHEAVPAALGSYRILRVIGEGGMGRVYEAEQSSPRRTVALKVIRPGLLNRGVLRRFEHEAAVLGQLHHPGIAQVYEAGTVQTAAGKQPFIAMELVRGERLDAFCRRKDLSVRERLLLVAAVCDAVQHAHQMGVIHRDLKPGNILVEETGDAPSTGTGGARGTGTSHMTGAVAGRPRIVDFGIARATTGVSGQDESTVTLNTEPGAIVGTLGYMSPEQALGGAPVDTRSDVYALGAILYELLAEKPAIDVRGVPIAEAARRVREVEPVDLGSVAPSLRGDVATIVGKALAKEKSRRYGSAGELGADIRRFLADEPILARRASRAYLLGKFARRNKTLVGAAAAMVVVLIGATVVSMTLYLQARSARRAEARQLLIAERAAADSDALNQFLVDDLLRSASPERDGLNTTVVQVFQKARGSVAQRFGKTPSLEAQVRARLADILQALGQNREALEEAAAAEALCDRIEPTIDLEDTDLRDRLRHARVRALFAADRAYAAMRDFDKAEQMARKAIARADECAIATTWERAQIRLSLGELLQISGRMKEAEPEIRGAIEAMDWTQRDQITVGLSGLSSLAGMYLAEKNLDKAEEVLQEMLRRVKETKTENSPGGIAALNQLATLYHNRGEHAKALEHSEGAWKATHRLYPDGHPMRYYAEFSYGVCLASAGRSKDAEPRFLAALAVAEAAFGKGAYETERAVSVLRNRYMEQGRYTEALPLVRRALASRLILSGLAETETLGKAADKYKSEMKKAAPEEFETGWTWFFEFGDKELPKDHPRRTRYFTNLGWVLMGLGTEEGALRALRTAWDARTHSDAPEYTAQTAKMLGAIHEARGESAEAERWRALSAEPTKK